MDPTAVLVMLDDLSIESSVMRSVMVRPMAPECSEWVGDIWVVCKWVGG